MTTDLVFFSSSILGTFFTDWKRYTPDINQGYKLLRQYLENARSLMYFYIQQVSTADPDSSVDPDPVRKKGSAPIFTLEDWTWICYKHSDSDSKISQKFEEINFFSQYIPFIITFKQIYLLHVQVKSFLSCQVFILNGI